jgi:HK97 family phage portal protein
MGLWSKLAGAFRRQPPQDRAFSEPFWSDLGFGAMSLAGETVNWKTALEVTTALRCGLVIADGVATVPCKIMRKDPATGRRSEATDHPLHELFGYAVNDWMDPLEFLQTVTLHVIFTGNAYVFINRVRGRIVELIPLMPHCVMAEQKDDLRLVYTVTAADGSTEEFPAETIWHMRAPSWNAWSGLDITKLAREALGLSLATQNAHSRRFGNGIQTTGMFSVKGTLNEEQHKRLRSYIESSHVGAKNSGKPFILDSEGKWEALDLTGVDAQHLETRRHQVEEVCRAYGVLPIMVGHYDKAATYASAEQMFLHHAVGTVRPWHRRFEKSMRRSLLSRDEVKAGYYIKFFDTELLRGAAKDRAEYYWKRFQMGMSPNQIAEFEDEDAYEGGDIHLVPSNMQTVENAKAAAPQGTTKAPAAPIDPTESPNPDGQPSDRMNAGRVLSAENEGKIRGARDNLDTVLAKLEEQQEP